MWIRTDIYDDGTDLHIEMELPGTESTELDLTLDLWLLSVTVHPAGQTDENRRYYRRERPPGPARRELPLPRAVRPAGAIVHFVGGVLRVRAPLLDARSIEPRRILIRSLPGDPAEERTTGSAQPLNSRERMGGFATTTLDKGSAVIHGDRREG